MSDPDTLTRAIDRSNDSLSVRTQIWASHREFHGPDSGANQGGSEILRKQRISIMDEESGVHEDAGFGIGQISSELSDPLAIR